MKMKYEKPHLLVESFQLNAAIAGDCADAGRWTLGQSIDTCTLNDNRGENYGTPLFGAACGVNIYESSEDGACYQSFTATEMYLQS